MPPTKGFQLAIGIVAGFVAAFTVAMVFVNVNALRKTHLGSLIFFYADAVREIGKGLSMFQTPKVFVGEYRP